MQGATAIWGAEDGLVKTRFKEASAVRLEPEGAWRGEAEVIQPGWEGDSMQRRQASTEPLGR